MESGDEFRLKPADCPSAEDWQRRLAEPIGLPVPEAPEPSWQFSLADVLWWTAGAGVGFAGGRWMPPDYFASLIGLITVAGILVVSCQPPESPIAKRAWTALVIAYFTAIFSVLVYLR